MKAIEHSYCADLSWVEPLTQQLKGKVKGNFIIVPESIQSGTRYFLECEEGIVAYYINVEYHKNLNFVQKKPNNDFVGFYYDLTDGEARIITNNIICDLGRWKYNLAVIDGNLKTNYNVKSGSHTYALCIFIQKNKLAAFIKDDSLLCSHLEKITNAEKNTVIRFDRISNESFHILNDLRKLKVGGPVFDLNLKATVHMLMSNYLKKIAFDKTIIQKVKETDIKNIITMQMFLIENIEGHFPSITLMSKIINMSESKFKILFKKITGLTPNAFFLDNKMALAKELLEEKQLSISQISNRLHYSNNSHFTSKFKEHFGLTPKNFINQL
ncbi:MAG: helix-turn-helix transcriptional regulator [Flavobacterium sp.]